MAFPYSSCLSNTEKKSTFNRAEEECRHFTNTKQTLRSLGLSRLKRKWRVVFLKEQQENFHRFTKWRFVFHSFNYEKLVMFSQQTGSSRCWRKFPVQMTASSCGSHCFFAFVLPLQVCQHRRRKVSLILMEWKVDLSTEAQDRKFWNYFLKKALSSS